MASAPSQSPQSQAVPAEAPATTTTATILEADTDDQDSGNDGDSAYSFDGASETASVTSSVYKYRVENGRTYHSFKAGEVSYLVPNGEAESERLDLQHNLLLMTQENKLFISPAGKEKPLHRVLGVGTGTGIWAIEFADEHPETSVVGVDLSPIQPSFVPPNVEFFVDDLEADWTFVRPFDFIYVRMMTGSIKDWPKLFRQAYQHLKPGSYIELMDPISPVLCDDGTMPDDCPLVKWNRNFLDASIKLGSPMNSAEKYKQQLIDAGFINVVQVEYKWAINPWPKDPLHKNLGAWCHENMSQGLQALSLMLFTNVLGWSVEEVESMLVGVRQDLRNRRIHGYWPVYTVYGQKPE